MPVSAKLGKLLDVLRTSFWFIPLLMVGSAIVLAGFTIDFDTRHDLGRFWRFRGDASASRELLAMMAGSMATVGGVTFSITMVVLSLAASQLGPRLLRSFMRDRIVHIVLGAFFATFSYCLVVLRSIYSRDDGGNEFIPHLSVTLASLFTLFSLGLFIFFIHHVARAIQAPRLVATVGEDLNQMILSNYPPVSQQSDRPAQEIERLGISLPENFMAQACRVAAIDGCYVQAIDYKRLVEIATDQGLLVVVDTRPGDFVMRNNPLAYVGPRADLDEKTLRAVRSAFVLGRERTLIQDVRLGIAQLVEVAAIALSPGINEPFTAISCIHRLSDSITLVALRGRPSPYCFDEASGRLLLRCMQVSFRDLCDEAFATIRAMAARQTMVLTHLMAALAAVAGQVRLEGDRQVIQEHADKALAVARRSLAREDNMEPLLEQHALVIERLQRGGFVQSYRTAQSQPEKPSPPPPPPAH